MLITRTGRYKAIMVAGIVLMGVGIWLLTQLHYGSSQTRAHGRDDRARPRPGHGAAELHARRPEHRRRADLGVATAATQFFRNVGATVGIAVFGTVMTSGLAGDRLAPPARGRPPDARRGPSSAGSVLDPAALAGLPPSIADAVRQGLADSAARGVPRRHAARARRARRDDGDQGRSRCARPRTRDVPVAEEVGHEVLDAMAQSAPGTTRDDAASGDRDHDRHPAARHPTAPSGTDGTSAV